jgi:hypothetical protein
MFCCSHNRPVLPRVEPIQLLGFLISVVFIASLAVAPEQMALLLAGGLPGIGNNRIP